MLYSTFSHVQLVRRFTPACLVCTRREAKPALPPFLTIGPCTENPAGQAPGRAAGSGVAHVPAAHAQVAAGAVCRACGLAERAAGVHAHRGGVEHGGARRG